MSARASSLWLWLLGLLMLVSFVFFALRVESRGRYAAPYSTHGAGPEGTFALFRLVEELGLRPARLEHEIGHLELGTLFAIAGCDGAPIRELLRTEHDELARWVEAGGLLIVASAEGFLPEQSGLHFDRQANCADPDKQSWLKEALGDLKEASSPLPRVMEAIPIGPPLAHLEPFDIAGARTLRVGVDHEATLLLSSKFGPLGLTTPVGRGRVVLLGASEALTNRSLERGGGAVIARLLGAFAPPGPVWFDEYHLGMGVRRSLIRYLRDRGYGVIALQVVWVVLAFLLARTARLGRPKEETRSLPRQAASYLGALGANYARSHDHLGALGVLTRDALRTMARHYRAVHATEAARPDHGGVEPERLAAWLTQNGFDAGAELARKLESHAERLLERGESLLERAKAVEQDLAAAIALTKTQGPAERRDGDGA